mgnify:CR=1 FL=1
MLEHANFLNAFLTNDAITEILINSFNEVYFEENGRLQKSASFFGSQQEYHNFIDDFLNDQGTFLNREKPYVELQHGKNRVSILYSELTQKDHIISIRKHPTTNWTLNSLAEKSFCTEFQKN